jgi:RNA polymerase sigma-70 factor (ECF subfamily)
MTKQNNDVADKALLEAVSRHEADSFNVLYDKYNRLLYTRVSGRLEDPEQSKEIMQDFWIRIWEDSSFVKVNTSGSAKGFLYHYLSYRVLDFIRKESFNIIAAATCESLEDVEEKLSYVHVSEEYERKEFEVQIASILNSLPEQTAEIFVLHWQKDYSLKEIAGLLQLNERTVRQKSKESIALLKELFKSGATGWASFCVIRNTASSAVYILITMKGIV